MKKTNGILLFSVVIVNYFDILIETSQFVLENTVLLFFFTKQWTRSKQFRKS